MRLAYCYLCRDLERLDDFKVNFDNPRFHEEDVLLSNWIERHLHGRLVEDHPGGRLFPFDESRSGLDTNMPVIGMDGVPTGEMLSTDDTKVFEAHAVEHVKAALAAQQMEVNEYRDQLREDAVECHRKHGQPSWPGKPCLDYQSDAKRLGRKNIPKSMQMYLCTFCPYQSSVTVEIRARRGDYRERR